MRRVIIESPYAGDIAQNLAYARRCMKDSLDHGEAPIASHLLYTQPGILDDNKSDERRLGINAGFAWWATAQAIIFYTDLGWSKGMLDAMARAIAEQMPHEIRTLQDKGSA